MKALSPALLAALAAGSRGNSGSQLWAELELLVGPERSQSLDGVAQELEPLRDAPSDLKSAHTLAAALNKWADRDPAFARALDAWAQRAQRWLAGPGSEASIGNRMNGGVVNGILIQSGAVIAPQGLWPEPPSPPRTLLRELPFDTPHFTGRQEHLAQLNGFLQFDSGIPPRVALCGTAGVGKTALALRWSRTRATSFPDGQLYLNLRGYDAGRPMTHEEALSQLLRALGIPGPKIPATLDEQTALYRSLLAEQQVLLLLDNAASTEQVRPLLPGQSPAMVLVTSRDQLHGLVARDGVHRLDLDVFELSEALELMARIAGTERLSSDEEAARDLAALCCRLPIALCITAEHLLSRPSLPLATAVEELKREAITLLSRDDDDQTNVRAIFSWSYRALPSQAHRAFPLLGLHPGPALSLPAASALFGLPAERTMQVLYTLTSSSLLSEPRLGRYGCHDLLRAYAKELASRKAYSRRAREAVKSVLGFYLCNAATADRALNPHRRTIELGSAQPGVPLEFRDWPTALGWFDSERVNLLAATMTAGPSGFHEVAWRLPLVCFTFLRLRSQWADYVAMFQAALSSTQELVNRYAEAWIHSNLGIGLKQMHRFDEAERSYERALSIRREIQDAYGVGQTLHHYGVLREAQQKQQEALVMYERALELHRSSGNRYCEATTLNSIAGFHTRQGDVKVALDTFAQALSIHRSIGYQYGVGECLHDLGMAQRSSGAVDTAAQSLSEAVSVRRSIGHLWGLAESLDQLAQVLVTRDRTALAARCWAEAISVYEQIGDPRAADLYAQLQTLPQTSFGDSVG
ncbi:Regulatory protein AfsR [Streptomyces sp. enrichment culture]|uniref:ATP-binding protein n=1 Tax=Streptomyces sp. enrichment culture TaxID=1795815 RepID=UPI003F543190